MLYRALRDVKRGFYVDVGANSPDLHSVTRALYERGWRGINIEPVAVFHEQLVASRPDDINLAVAIGDRSGVVNFYDIPDTGLSTVDGVVARQHLLSGYRVIDRQVPIETWTMCSRAMVSTWSISSRSMWKVTRAPYCAAFL